ncbi:putative nitrate assimilation regulatory protein nirA [Rosellinia necatrix]|uniref:Putative nitrate assimilation regulatory protein nirA n=1 Tax=Rosellinia necatrix TaxID=77044 RepID=A0A1W2TQM7_ROSNE|nr:putative nitrate assimilation regulatory protein nirA [Rosellinia necatrix]
MSSFRSIRPLPRQSQPANRAANNAADGGSAGNPFDGAATDGSSSSSPDGWRPRKRSKVVSQACRPCRKAKAKCDGERPSCQRCLSKDRECDYEHEEGQSKVAALRSRIQSANDGEEARNADLCCLMVVAASGALYTDTADAAASSAMFYGIAKIHFDAVLETRPLDAIKVCTLFCLYNILDKAVTSIAYADIGLGLCHRFGLYSKHPQSPDMADSMWVDYRRAWRTLIFFSSWLSATLGYGSGNQDLFQKIPAADFMVNGGPDISEIVQAKMTGIAVLNLKILYMHMVYSDVGGAIDGTSRDLQEWYMGMPEVMHLSALHPDSVLPLEAKRSMCLVHLLYLGANMLLFRRVAFEAIRSSTHHGVPPPQWKPSREQYLRQADSASLAASNSARIIDLMMREQCVFKRCWIIIFQSYTSCLILQHSIMRKAALDEQPSAYEDDLQNIDSCLRALLFCASLDPVAARFHRTVLSIHESLVQNHLNKRARATEGNMSTESQQPVPALQTIATAKSLEGDPQQKTVLDDIDRVHCCQYVDPSLQQLSTDVLMRVCRPFGDPVGHGQLRGGAGGQECRYLTERSGWDFEDNAPFQWDMGKLGISNDRISQLSRYSAGGEGCNAFGSQLTASMQRRFMDSPNPNGWASAEHLQINPTESPGASHSEPAQ